MTSLQKIRRWLKEKDYNLHLRKGLRWRVNLTTKLLTGDPAHHLDYPLNSTEKLAMLLHECGHIDRQRSIVMLGTPWDLDVLLPPLKPGKKPSTAWYIAIVREEMDAWDSADQIAKRLAIEGLSKAMARMRRKCLMTYISWASERGRIIGFSKK